MSSNPDPIPASLRLAMAGEPLPTGRWDKVLAPHYIGLFLWLVFFDQLARETLAIGGLFASLKGLLAAGFLAFGLLYLGPALLGVTIRRPLQVVSSSTFGARGSVWIPGFVIGITQVIWFSLTIYYATTLSLRAMGSAGLLDAGRLDPIQIGGHAFPSVVFLVTSLVWALSAALIGTLALKLVAAVMSVFPVFPAIAMGAAMILAFRVPGGREMGALVGVPRGSPAAHPEIHVLIYTIQIVFAFFATAGVESIEIGATARTRWDVILAGFVGVAAASVVIGTLALVTVASSVSSQGDPRDPFERKAERSVKVREPLARPFERAPITQPRVSLDPPITDYQAVLMRTIGGWPGCLLLITFATACLGPACYTAAIFSRRFVDVFPRVKRWQFGLFGALVAWPGMVWGTGWDLLRTFTLAGALMAPVVGAITADYLRGGGRRPVIRGGWSVSGLVAWGVGLAVGLIPLTKDLGLLAGDAARSFQPSALYAFVVALVVKLVLGLAIGERAVIAPRIKAGLPLEKPASDPVQASAAESSEPAPPEAPMPA